VYQKENDNALWKYAERLHPGNAQRRYCLDAHTQRRRTPILIGEKPMKLTTSTAIMITAAASIPLMGGPLLLFVAWEAKLLALFLIGAGTAITAGLWMKLTEKH
jgi:hypothetical protein